MPLIQRPGPILDGSSVSLGNAKPRAVIIPAGEYGTPLWVRDGGSLVHRIDALPWQGILVGDSIEVLSGDPGVSQLGITTTSLPNATEGVAYNQTVQANGGQTPYAWSIVGGSLGDLSIHPSTGAITGTPSNDTDLSFTVRVTDDNLDTADQALSITVNAAGGPSPIATLIPDNYASLSALLAESHLSDNTDFASGPGQNDDARLSLETVSTTPWGTTKVVRNNFDATGLERQPQTGIQVSWSATGEVWIIVRWKFSSNWTTYPISQGGGRSHKSALIYEENGARWGWAYGGIGDYITAGPAGDFNQYWAANPMMPGSFGSTGGWDGVDSTYAARIANALATDLAWDDSYHETHHHIKRGAGDGIMEHWEDGVQLIDASDINVSLTGGGFTHIQLGANRNSGPTEAMSYDIAGVWVYDQEPVGWPS